MMGEMESDCFCLPTLRSTDYFTVPSIEEILALEVSDSGYCGRVPDFVVGRVGYGQIKFFGFTDVRGLDLDEIVKFDRHSVVLYEDENGKPAVGCGLNKAAEVTLVLDLEMLRSRDFGDIGCESRLRWIAERQGARFLSFDCRNGEWRFVVEHFSRFGLDDEEEEDVAMDDVNVEPVVKEPEVLPSSVALSHSLPANLGLDAAAMHHLRALVCPSDEEDENYDTFQQKKAYSNKGFVREDSPFLSAKSSSCGSPFEGSSWKADRKSSPLVVRKEPQALLEYHPSSSDLSPCPDIHMTGQKKGLPLTKLSKGVGFKLEEKHETPLTGDYSRNIVDSGLFMGRSFRVGWGPNGILIHSGTPVGSPKQGLSSIVHIEKVCMDKVVRDEKDKVNSELIDLCFSSLLNLHMKLDREITEHNVGSCIIRHQKVVCNRSKLSEICHAYTDIIEKQMEITGLSPSSRMYLIHQISIWDLIKVLFSEKETNVQLQTLGEDDIEEDDGEEMILDKKDRLVDVDTEAKPLIRRANFSYWLQDTVCHRVQEDVSCLNESSYLEQMLLLLSGRQLDAAVELAASQGDVRLAILLSQAGGSAINRYDMSQQLELWKMNGLDFKFIENDRLKLYELLAGNIHGAFPDLSIDWKRYLGLVLWYQLPPDTSLPVIIHSYNQLLSEERVPFPVPVYIDEGPLEESPSWSAGDRFDIAYYLMLLHANDDKDVNLLKTMFSAYSSTHDPLDYHMIWHQRSILEAIGAFSSSDLHVLDMSFVSQLLCLGQCHWAIYVVMHMPYHDGLLLIQAKVIKDILLQYCETWSTQEAQFQFIEDLGIPSEWMHEAMAIYSEYHGDLLEAIGYYILCFNWQKAHSIFMTSVAHHLFLSSKDQDIWQITSSMEEHKSEIADWDLGAGIYLDFYILRSSLQDDTMDELDTLEKKNEACESFFSRLNESILLWNSKLGGKLPVDARATFSKMSEELCNLLVSSPSEGSTSVAVQMSCFKTILSAPTPQDIQSGRLQEAVSFYAYLLSEAT